mgnify:FL=1
MPTRLGDSNAGGAPTQNVSGAASNSPVGREPVRAYTSAAGPTAAAAVPRSSDPQPPRAVRPQTGPRDDDAVPEGQAGDDDGGGFTRKRYDEYSALTAGRYSFLASVNQIVRWERGVSLTFKVLPTGSADHDDRQVEWQQSPPAGQSTKFNANWLRKFFGAYAAGGWTVDKNPTTGWDGWQPSTRKGSDGNPLPRPPYNDFFVVHAGGLWIPTVLRVEVTVDAPPYDKYPKVTRVEPLLVDQRRVQAPMPWRVIDWIAESLGWLGSVESVNKATLPVVKLDYKQLEQGAGGLLWWREAVRRLGTAARPVLPGQPRPVPGTEEIWF